MKKNLTNIETVGSTVYLWFTDENGKLSQETIQSYKPYFYIEDNQGKFDTIDGYKVKKVFFESSFDLKEAKPQYDHTWEADVDYKTKYLIDSDAYKHNREAGLLPIRTWFIDIETQAEKGFPNYKNPINKITAISFYDNILDTTISVAFHPNEYKNNDNWKSEGVIVVQTEQEMLQLFIGLVQKLQPQTISGWNSEHFDYPYILARIYKVLPEELKKLSPIGKVDVNHQTEHYKIFGITELDYLKLYKQKFAINLRESYTLDYIAKYELGEGKTEYDGNLDDLWLNHFDKFIKYNRQDVELVKKLDDKLKYIDLAREITTTCNNELKNIFYSSALNEALILTSLKKLNLVCFNKPEKHSDQDPFAGAFVMDPIRGIHNWIFSLDLTSLYPSILRTNNMSFETIIDNPTFDEQEKYYRTCNDQYFTKEFRGIIPKILDELFETRVEYKRLLKEAKKVKNKSAVHQYDLKQYSYKIILNSIYGYLGMDGGRFYDRRIAEGVTLTGQEIIQSSIKYIETNYKDKLKAIYSDTDSIYIKYLQDVKSKEEILKLAEEVQEDLNTNHLSKFALEENNADNHFYEFKFEKVMKSGLFLAKKRYALNVIWEEGFDKDNILKVTGMETVRSDTPEACSDFLEAIIKMMLDGTAKDDIDQYIVKFETDIKSMPLKMIGFPTGVKGIKKYMVLNPNSMNETSICKKGTPAHSKSAINYNVCFAENGKNKEFPLIKENEKIKWIYVKPTIRYPFSCMAFTNEVIKHMRNFEIDWDKVIQRLIKQKVENIYTELNWSIPVDKSLSVSDELFE